MRYYRQMVTAGPERYENIATARRTLRRNLELLETPAAAFEKELAVPKVAAFVGHDVDAADRTTPRFPARMEYAVRSKIAKALRAAGILYSVSSAGAGADIIFLEEMKVRNGFMQVVLPCPRGQFMREFLSPHWQRRFELAMDHPLAEVVELAGDPDELWDAFRPKLWEFAEAKAKLLDEKPMLLAVWDGKPGFIQNTVEEWRGRGAGVQHLGLGPE